MTFYFRKIVIAFSALCAVGIGGAAPRAADPAIDVTRLLDTTGYDGMKFYENGRMMLDDVGVIFRPEGAHNGVVELQKASGEIVAALGFFDGYQWSNSVFGDIRPQNGGMLEPTGVGDFQLVFKINGAAATVLPFSVIGEGGDDPFNPDTKYYFSGPWEQLAYLRTSTNYSGGPIEATVWFSGADMPAEGKGHLTMVLSKGGAVLARSKSPKIINKRSKIFAQFRSPLFKPADGVNPPIFTLDELRATDGDYVLTAMIDETPVRSFPIRVSGGKIAVSARSQMGHQPHTDYLAPRFVNLDDRILQGYAPEEIFWLEAAQ